MERTPSSSTTTSSSSSSSWGRSPLSPKTAAKKANHHSNHKDRGDSQKLTMANRMYRTLPSALRRDDRAKVSSSSNSEAQAQQGQLFGNFNWSNIINGINIFGNALRRKAASTSTTPVSAGHSSPSSSVSSGPRHSSSAVFFSDVFESIELMSFPCLPEAGEGHTGEGHLFVLVGTFNPTWCDLCGDLIWGLYDTGASKCEHCDFTCHVKCQKRVRLNCSSLNPEKKSDCNIPREDEEKASESVYKTAFEELLPDQEEDDEEEATLEDDSTLANISTLRSELNNETLVASLPISPSEIKTSVVSSQGCRLDHDDDDDDQFKTLRDVDHIDLEHDSQHFDYETSKAQLSLIDTLQLPLRAPDLFGNDLEAVVEKYNSECALGLGQETVFESSDVLRGLIRVQMNLRRPINVISGTRPPSIYNITKEDTWASNRKTLTSFYLPPDTMKALHVTTETTTIDLIRSLLSKFRVADNPHKYALYEKSAGGASVLPEDKSTLSRIRMRRMKDEERPLVLALKWCRDSELRMKVLVLQENDPGEISWDSFSVPELKNFLLILDREEAWYKKKIHEKYELVHNMMKQLAEEKRIEMEQNAEEKRDNSTKI